MCYINIQGLNQQPPECEADALATGVPQQLALSDENKTQVSTMFIQKRLQMC